MEVAGVIYILKWTCAYLAILFLILTLIFDVWIYKTTKDLDFVLSFSITKYQSKNERLTQGQFLLLKIINYLKKALLAVGFLTVISIVVSIN